MRIVYLHRRELKVVFHQLKGLLNNFVVSLEVELLQGGKVLVAFGCV